MTYTYDGSERTTAVMLPDGSITTTSYACHRTTVMDPTGKWTTYTNRAMGNLITEAEPNRQVSMPRPRALS